MMVSVLMMCAGSLMIAVMPTYASIGIAAPALLLGARLLQGLSVGGEYGTAATYMKAKKKPLETLTPMALGVDVAPRLTLVKVEEPAKRKAGVRVADVRELVHKLRSEAKVI